jgi:hypothetical protein
MAACRATSSRGSTASLTTVPSISSCDGTSSRSKGFPIGPPRPVTAEQESSLRRWRPYRHPHVYVLRELHGLRIDETASELGLAPGQVEQALFAARNRLAELLVFGERLSCVAVRRLACGPLDTDERRALKTHLRSCGACRKSVGATGHALGILPAGIAGWLRALPALIAGGGSPAAVKIGAVVATATLATGAPIAYEVTKPAKPRHVATSILDHAPPRRYAAPPRFVLPKSTAAVVGREPATPVSYHARRVAAVKPSHATASSAEREGRAPGRVTVPSVVSGHHQGDDSGDDHRSSEAAPAAPVVTTESAVRSGGGEDTPATTTAPGDDGSDGAASTPYGSQGHGQDEGTASNDGQSQDGTTGPASGGGDGGSGGHDGGDSGTGGSPPSATGD